MNAVSPGLSNTDIHASGGEHSRVDQMQDSVPLKRGSSEDEVARAVTWLRSEDAIYVTGTHVDDVGGGQYDARSGFIYFFYWRIVRLFFHMMRCIVKIGRAHV